MEKNDFYELIDGIVDCADKVAKLGRLLREFVPQFVSLLPEEALEVKATKVIEEAPKPKKAKKEEVTETTYSFEDVRKAFAAKSHAGFTAEVKELISKYGASRLSDINESDYTAIMKELEVIG